MFSAPRTEAFSYLSTRGSLHCMCLLSCLLLLTWDCKIGEVVSKVLAGHNNIAAGSHTLWYITSCTDLTYGMLKWVYNHSFSSDLYRQILKKHVNHMAATQDQAGPRVKQTAVVAVTKKAQVQETNQMGWGER